MLFHPTPAFKAYALDHRERGIEYLKLVASIGPNGEPLHCFSCGSATLNDTIISSESVDILPRPKGRGFLLDGDVPPREC